MIDFNRPPYTGRELEYIRQAVEANKICGDGEFTKRCSAWMKEKSGDEIRPADHLLHPCPGDGGLPFRYSARG